MKPLKRTKKKRFQHIAQYIAIYLQTRHRVVADPGFPLGGGANPPGAPAYDFAKFSKKSHEIERIWTPRGWAGVQNFTM